MDFIDGGAGRDTIVFSGQLTEYQVRFNLSIGCFSIVDLRAGSPDGTDLANVEVFRFGDGQFTTADLNYIIAADSAIAWDVAESDGSRSVLGWTVSATDPSKWDSYVRRFNINRVKISETIFRSDHSRIAYAWDVDQSETWASYVQTFDTEARLTKQDYGNDDGTRTVVEWDPADLQIWYRRVSGYNAVDPDRIVTQEDRIDAGAIWLDSPPCEGGDVPQGRRFGAGAFTRPGGAPERAVPPEDIAALEAARPILKAAQRVSEEQRTIEGLKLGRFEDRRLGR